VVSLSSLVIFITVLFGSCSVGLLWGRISWPPSSPHLSMMCCAFMLLSD
jgi:hypothetical protein